MLKAVSKRHALQIAMELLTGVAPEGAMDPSFLAEALEHPLRRVQRLTLTAAGEENQFLFGLSAEQILGSRSWYDSHWHCTHEPEARSALDLIAGSYLAAVRTDFIARSWMHTWDTTIATYTWPTLPPIRARRPTYPDCTEIGRSGATSHFQCRPQRDVLERPVTGPPCWTDPARETLCAPDYRLSATSASSRRQRLEHNSDGTTDGV